jgi:acyl-CoA reductase-like NAD-dependent aldehyde dehydrogenase
MPTVNTTNSVQVLRPYDQRVIREIPMVPAEMVMGALADAHRLFQDQSASD